MENLGEKLLVTSAYALLGILIFALIFFIVVKVAPFSVRKEIEQDQNTALAVLFGSVFIGVALIIAATVHG